MFWSELRDLSGIFRSPLPTNLRCFFVDSKVDVIYVCPVELTDDVDQYYSKLLAMRAASHAKDEPVENRYKIVVPDAVHRFPVSVQY